MTLRKKRSSSNASNSENRDHNNRSAGKKAKKIKFITKDLSQSVDREVVADSKNEVAKIISQTLKVPPSSNKISKNKFDSTKKVDESQVYLRKHTSMRTKVSAKLSNLSSAADNVVTKSMKASKALEKEIDEFLKQPKTPYNQVKVKSLSPHRDSPKGQFVQRAVIGTSQDIKDAE